MINGNEVCVVSYKHNGKVHRSWYQITLVEETSDFFVVGSTHSLVIEADGRRWMANEPAIYIYFKNSWYNVVAMMRDDGIYYYVNIASPSILSKNMIKYIDYDLDFKVNPEYFIKALDEFEYKVHKKQMNYSSDLDKVIKSASKNVKKMIVNQEFPFKHDKIEEYYNSYIDLIKSRSKQHV